MNLVWAVLIVLGVAALAIAAMLLVRRGAPDGSYFEDGDRASGIFGVLATGFAVLIGFVVFLSFESFDTSRSGAEAEARTVVQQFETAQFLPIAVRARISGDLVCYARAVIYQEWPRMESGTLGDSRNPLDLGDAEHLADDGSTRGVRADGLRQVVRSAIGPRGRAR
jgi:hypothetical protein